MFDVLSDIVEGTVDLVDEAVDTVVGGVVDSLPSKQTVGDLVDTGLTIVEISDMSGIAVSVLEGILDAA